MDLAAYLPKPERSPERSIWYQEFMRRSAEDSIRVHSVQKTKQMSEPRTFFPTRRCDMCPTRIRYNNVSGRCWIHRVFASGDKHSEAIKQGKTKKGVINVEVGIISSTTQAVHG